MDTNVLSAGAPGRRERTEGLVRWMEARSRALFLSTVTVAELASGIAKLKRAGSVSRASRLGEWLELVLHLYGGRVLPLDVPAARLAGQLMDKARAAGHTPGFADIAIAATAASRRLTILTRNLRHFAPLGVPTTDPFDTLPS